MEKTGKDQARGSQRSSGEEGYRGGWGGGVGGTQEGAGRGEAGSTHWGGVRPEKRLGEVEFDLCQRG